MSNLVPTPRTDRNGRTQIRHMRADKAASAAAARIPSPASPAPDPDAAAAHAALQTVGAASALAYPGASHAEAARAWKAVAYLHEDDPVMLDLALRLSHEGSAMAGKAVALRLRSILYDLDGFDKLSDRAAARKARNIAKPVGRNSMALAWHAGALYGEAVASDERDRAFSLFDEGDRAFGRFIDEVAALEAFLNIYDDGGDRTDDPDAAAYWRGLAAFLLADEEFDRMSLIRTRGLTEQVLAFARFAGAHPDPAAVIAAQKATGSLDPDHLSHIIGQRGSVEPALRDGAL